MKPYVYFFMFTFLLGMVSGCNDNSSKKGLNSDTARVVAQQQNVSEENDYTDVSLLKALNVQIKTYFKDGSWSKGSGVCLDKNIVVTNYHVIYPVKNSLVDRVEVRNLKDDIAQVIKLNVSNVENDVATLVTDINICERYVPSSDFKTVADISNKKMIHVGNPGDLNWEVREGYLRQENQMMNFPKSILKEINWITADTKVASTSIDTNPGSSGGGVYTEDGLVGLLFAGGHFEEYKKDTLVISAEYLKSFRDEANQISKKDLIYGKTDTDYMEATVNHQQTFFILSEAYKITKGGRPISSLMTDDLYTNELEEAIEDTTVRKLHFFNFSPDITMVFRLADRDKNGSVDAVFLMAIKGFHKVIPDAYDLVFRGVIVDEDGDSIIDSVEMEEF